jgi:ubiquinone/menaquinone biosynthesis C-methylase UbiE
MLSLLKRAIPTPAKAWLKHRIVGQPQLDAATAGANAPARQDLDIYWSPDFAEMLEHWGEGNAWHEIRYLMAPLDGPILDIACGTGRVMEILSRELGKDLFGCDISEFLLSKAEERGIPKEKLFVEDATAMSFDSNRFAFGYSIGSLEHFTDDGILAFLRECARVVEKQSFHMIPVSRSGTDQGWLTTQQSFFNNSVEWWLERYRSAYPVVRVIDSLWNDEISVGKWFICSKD